MGKPTSLQQRIEVLKRAAAGANDSQIAADMQMSVATVRKWRRRGQRQGRAGLVSVMGRPAEGALSSFAPQVRKIVKVLRRAHPGWGPLTLGMELAAHPQLQGLPLPGRSQIAAYLHELETTRSYQHRTTLSQAPQSAVDRAHQVWELDAQGVQTVTGVGQVVLINLLDVYSRVKVESWACTDLTKASTPDYQLACRRGFWRYGLPQQLSLDHDTVFYDSQSSSPYPTRFHLWLLALGITVSFIQRPPPLEHSGIERMHQVMSQQALVGQHFDDREALQRTLDQRRRFLNTRYPPGGDPTGAPLQRYPEARHSGRSYRPEDEAQVLELARVYAYLADQHWYRRVSTQGQITLGGYRYGLGTAWRQQEVELTCDAPTQEFYCYAADGQLIKRLAVQGLDKADLMGELAVWQSLPAYQLPLPLDQAGYREACRFQALTGTTLSDF